MKFIQEDPQRRGSFLSPRFVSGHAPRVSVQAAGKREGWSNYRSVPSDWRAHDPSPPAVGLCRRQVGGVRSCRIRRENDKTRGALRPSDAFPAPPTSDHPRPLARLPERPYEWVGSARKRSSAGASVAPLTDISPPFDPRPQLVLALQTTVRKRLSHLAEWRRPWTSRPGSRTSVSGNMTPRSATMRSTPKSCRS